MRHLWRSFKANANHMGTSVAKLEWNGPKSPLIKDNTSELKFGTMDTSSSSACKWAAKTGEGWAGEEWWVGRKQHGVPGARAARKETG